jgi:hypothetical protein
MQNGKWNVYQRGFLDAKLVTAGAWVSVVDVSGCAAVFFYDTAGRASAAHITAGNEVDEAEEAATQAQDAMTIATIDVHTYSQTKFGQIKMGIRMELSRSIPVTYIPYTLNTSNRKARMMFSHQSGAVGSASAEAYTC